MKKITLLFALSISAVSFAQIAKTSFENPTLGTQYMDTGDATVAHDLVNNTDQAVVDFTADATEIGFNARYEPFDTPDVGLTDGDFVGVTDFAPGVDFPYTDGTQGYQISDADGNFILEFDTVDLTGATTPGLTMDYFLAETGYEGDGTVNESSSDRLRIYVKDLTNNTEIDILNTTGNDINDLGIEGAWNNGVAALLPNTMVQLVIEARMNAGAEAFFFDNIVFDGTLGINNVAADTFSIFPNPATSGVLNITSKNTGVLNVAIFDVLGKKVLNGNVTNKTMNISSLNSGVYIVKITQDNVTATKKLIVK
ncbi:T9SS C-terminal target domain-containing protein [Patiriisocius marinistellae]|uniref:T9SS C-terminal target domain-containing protein n=1 Tax=Patiriisocius marinistellae TaxID=2494560 RepID=A0A5J4FU34_9FLAO|nr:T9SS type A sorting domain-containing protein [Patiriisocius marinistellae]GEQ84568.1 T9SS C-terminal target domain-containing protein [Patiriisocius marinistellae]